MHDPSFTVLDQATRIAHTHADNEMAAALADARGSWDAAWQAFTVCKAMPLGEVRGRCMWMFFDAMDTHMAEVERLVAAMRLAV